MKKSNVFLALASVVLLVVCAGCITSSEPDPIVGTFVDLPLSNQEELSENQQRNATAKVDYGLPVGGISHSESILKFYEDGTLLNCYIADMWITHEYYKWTSIGNKTYLVTNNDRSKEYTLKDDSNELILTKMNDEIRNGPSYFRNDSYVIPEPYDPYKSW